MNNFAHPTSNNPLPLLELSGRQQAQLVQTGQVSCEQLRDAALMRITRLNVRLNALYNFDIDAARRAPARGDGPFAGVPTLLKDLLSYPGLPLAFGSRLLAGNVANDGSPYTQALDAAGLVVLGKTATSEFGLLGTTEPLANGATHNPWDTRRSPGGSSGGTAAAVAAGMVPVAHASDGGGSIRGPASFCGVFGFKPSRGRTASVGLPPGMPTADLLSDHCISRTVEDSALWLKVTEVPGDWPALTGLDDPGGRLRIGYYHQDVFGSQPTPDALAALETGVEVCSRLGHEVVPCAGPRIDADATSRAFHELTALVVGGMVQQLAAAMGPMFSPQLLEPYTQSLLATAQALDPGAIDRAVATLQTAQEQLQRAHEGVDVLLSPTVPFVAFELERYGPNQPADTLQMHINRLAGYTVAASLAGWPAMTVPLYWNREGLPLGCHFAARHGHDALLFRLAFALEQAAPWIGRLNTLSHSLIS